MAKTDSQNKETYTPHYQILLSPKAMDEVFEKIMQRLVVEKKYRDPNYYAKDLAKDLGLNSRYISAIINLRFHQNYSQLINDYRIMDVKYMLKDIHFNKLKLEEISAMAGFSNRQSFYTAFFNRCGVTPNEDRLTHAIQLERDLLDERRMRSQKTTEAEDL